MPKTAERIVEVWACPRCPDQSYDALVPVLGVACPVCQRAAKSKAHPNTYNMKRIKVRSRNGRLVDA